MCLNRQSQSQPHGCLHHLVRQTIRQASLACSQHNHSHLTNRSTFQVLDFNAHSSNHHLPLKDCSSQRRKDQQYGKLKLAESKYGKFINLDIDIHVWVLWYNFTTVISKLGALYSCSETLSEVEQYNSVVDVIKLKNQLEVFKHKELSFDELQVQTEVSSPAREEMKKLSLPIITGEYSATDNVKISILMYKCRVSKSNYIFYLIYIFMKFP